MDNEQTYKIEFVSVAAIIIVVVIALCAGIWGVTERYLIDDSLLRFFVWGMLTIAVIAGGAWLLMYLASNPLRILTRVVSYAGHARGGAPPKTEQGLVGSSLATALAADIYDLGTLTKSADDITATEQPQEQTAATKRKLPEGTSVDELFDKSPLPLIALDGSHNIVRMNLAALSYLDPKADTIGKPIFDIIKMQFSGDVTLEQWLQAITKQAAHARHSWKQVRSVGDKGETEKQFELVVSYHANSDQKQAQFIMCINDRSSEYGKLDRENSYLAIAVHELRTPLTVMKGYIEVLQDEAAPSLNPEMRDFLTKTQANAQQLTDFVGNILNIARIDENALVLNLQKYDWGTVLAEAVKDLQLRASVHGKRIEVKILNQLPPVAIDRISMYEVLNNLVDNAIKYSGDADRIIITAGMNNEGMVETSVQDFGQGIPDSVAGELFQKFYRSHRTKAGASGTGIGLFLCKSLVNAHGGHIWVKSKEGQGSTFSFTIQTFEAAQTDNEGQDGIERSAHGWIKNHSLNRQ